MRIPSFKFFVSAIFLVLWSGGVAFAAPKVSGKPHDPLCSLKYMTEEYRPFNFRDHKGRATGLSVEVLRRVMTELNCPEPDLTFYPWHRAYRTLVERPGTVLFSISKAEHRMHLCKFAGPVMKVNYALIARKSAGLQVNNLGDVVGLRVGVRQDGWAEAFFHSHLPTVELARKPRIEFAVNHVRKGNLDLFAYAEPGVPALLRGMHLNPEDYEIVYVMKPVSPFFGFHRDTPDVHVQRFQEALDKVLERSGFQTLVDEFLE